MPASSSRLTRAFFASLLLAAVFSGVALLVGHNRFHRFDTAITSAIQGLESPGWTKVMKGFTWIGSGEVVVVLAVLVVLFLYFVLGHRREVLLFLWTLGGSSLLNIGLKLLFQRDRPNLHRLIEETGYSFPSGHSMAAFSFYGILVYLLWRHIASTWGKMVLVLVSVVFILSIGGSRVYLGVHYPSDILGAYLASGIWLLLSIWWFVHRLGWGKGRGRRV
ncbi:phosphatase PAP2 family protein [Paenibacillus koleovorans]|uniref:phosphatase PAP2 family protein n=1 Tax=Paenibacillus koleovorans TaxID=121608 RepID=UPI000FDAD61B|nr:phosphatase PAP2 family protein [Paenibacillus koleovorans]